MTMMIFVFVFYTPKWPKKGGWEVNVYKKNLHANDP